MTHGARLARIGSLALLAASLAAVDGARALAMPAGEDPAREAGLSAQRRGGRDDGGTDDRGGRDDGTDDRGGRGRGRGRGGSGGGGNGGGGSGGGNRGGNRDRIRNDFFLNPTEEGAALGLKGKARTEARIRKGREKIKVGIESTQLPEGAVLGVWFRNPDSSADLLFLGDVTLEVNPEDPAEVAAEIELDSQEGDPIPDGASPVASITEFQVLDPATNAVLLSSSLRRSRGGSVSEEAGGGAKLRRRISLKPTADGATVRARGKAATETRVDRAVQKLKVEAEARGLAVGTVLEVWFLNPVHSPDPFFAGELVLKADGPAVSGELEFASNDDPPLPRGADPVNGITEIRIVDRASGTLLLAGKF